MPLNVDRFRRAELMLHGRLGAEIADVICTMIRLCAECSLAGWNVGDAVLIRLRDVADGLRRDRIDALNVLSLSDAIFRESFGVSMLAVGYGQDGLLEDTVVEVDPSFASIVNGSSIDVVSSALSDGIEPDSTTSGWLELVAAAAAGRGATHFLYRQSAGNDPNKELATVASAFVGLPLLTGHIVLPVSESIGATRLPIAAALLSAILTTDVAIMLSGAVVTKADIRTVVSDEFADPDELAVASSANAPCEFTADGERLLALLPHAPLTVVVPIPADTVLRPSQASPFVGAVGPFRQDRLAAIGALKARAAWPLSDQVAGRIVRLYPDPSQATPLLKGTSHIVAGRSRLAVAPTETDTSTERSVFDAGLYDRVAGDLANSLSGHIASPIHLRAKEARDPFFQELVTLDQPDLIFGPGRGKALRDAGAKLAFVGPPGCGKGMAAIAACAAMGCETIDVGAADFLAHKLGALEKSLRAIFKRARDHGNAALIFDEFDSIGSARENAGSASYIISVTNALLVECDAHHLPTIFITNFPERIDKALLRRCDLVLTLKPIPAELEYRAFELMLNGMRIPDDWITSGTLTVSDFAQARRMGRLTGDASSAATAAAIIRARDIRLGNAGNRGRMGFL